MALASSLLALAILGTPLPVTAPTVLHASRPIVYVQAGHQGPREPGYRAQTGASGESAWTQQIAAKVEYRLRRKGVDARHTAGLVTPNPTPGAVFISIHYDIPTGHAAVGHAITGFGENYYHGEGFGAASSTPYADSVAHRGATRVSYGVQSASTRLANRLAARYRRVFTQANGARSGGVQLVTSTGNRRMMRYYGYYRSNASARVLVECGAVGTDAAFLKRKDFVASVIANAIVAHLKAEGKL